MLVINPKCFQKNAVGITEITVEVNGTPCYPFPQPLQLQVIHNNNYDALDKEEDDTSSNYVHLNHNISIKKELLILFYFLIKFKFC